MHFIHFSFHEYGAAENENQIATLQLKITVLCQEASNRLQLDLTHSKFWVNNKNLFNLCKA